MIFHSIRHSPFNGESYQDDDESYGDWPEKVSVVGVLDVLAASRLDVFPCNVRRKPNLNFFSYRKKVELERWTI